MIGLMVDMLMVFFPCGELVFVLSGVGPILRNGVEFRDKLFQENEISAGFLLFILSAETFSLASEEPKKGLSTNFSFEK